MYAQTSIPSQHSRTLKIENNRPGISFTDHRPAFAVQRKMTEVIQRGKIKRMQSGTDILTILATLLGAGLSFAAYKFLPSEAERTLGGMSLSALLGGLFAGGLTAYARGDDLDDLADGLGISRELLLKRMQRGFLTPQGELDEETFSHFFNGKEIRHRKFGLLDSQQIVPKELLSGLSHKSDDQKVSILFERFKKIPFFYAGSQSPANGFYTHLGDCSTLASMFQLATQAAGVQGVEIASDEGGRLIDASPIHGRSAQGNTKGALYWHFVNHFWCTYKGQAYDPLFMLTRPVPSHKLQKTILLGGKNVEVYEGGLYCYEEGQLYVTESRVAMESYLKIYPNSDIWDLYAHHNLERGIEDKADWDYVAD